MDELLAKLGEKPTVEVALQIGGKLIATFTELERRLEDIRQQIAHQLEANHRVRSK